MVEDLHIPGLYSTIRKNALVGDRVYLDKLLFDAGSSKLKESAKKELDKITILLKRYPNINIEIQGHFVVRQLFTKKQLIKTLENVNFLKTVPKEFTDICKLVELAKPD